MALNTYQVEGGSLILPMGLNPATVAGGSWNNQLITEFDRELYKRVYTSRDEIDRHPNRGKFYFTDLIKYLGYHRPILPGVDGSYGHWEKDWIRQSLIVGTDGLTAGSGGTGAGKSFKFKLAVDSIFEGDDGRRYSYARENEIIKFQINSINVYSGWIKSVTASGSTYEIEVVPNDSSVDLLAALGGVGSNKGVEFAVGDTAYPEGSNHGYGRQSRNLKYKNNVQIIRDDNIETGSSRVRSYEIERVVDDKGNLIAWELKGDNDAFNRLKYQRESAICTGVLNDNFFETDPSKLTPDMTNVHAQTTEGIFTFAMKHGYTNPYGSVMSIDMLDAKNDILDAEAAPDNYIIAGGSPYIRLWRDALKDYLGDTSINQYSTAASTVFASGDDAFSKALAIEVAFSSVRLQGSNRTFHMKTIDTFNDPKALGASHYTYRNMGFFLPVGDVKNNMSKGMQSELYTDNVDASRVPYFGYVYSARTENGGINMNREMHVWNTGGNAATPTDGWDVSRLHLLGEIGASAAAGNLFITDYPTAGGSGS
jgi:hypothetical protein